VARQAELTPGFIMLVEKQSQVWNLQPAVTLAQFSVRMQIAMRRRRMFRAPLLAQMV